MTVGLVVVFLAQSASSRAPSQPAFQPPSQAPEPSSQASQPSSEKPNKIDIVSVTGCLREPSPTAWTLSAATDPVPSNANAPPRNEIPSTPPVGQNEFRLIGVSEFNLPAHRGQTVVVKGLLIKAAPMSRLNITSVTMVSASCVAAVPK